MTKISLSKLIFRQYARSALFVLLTVEVLLLTVYFATNAYIADRTEKTLTEEAEQVAPRVVALSADVIEEMLSSVAAKTRFFAESHVRLFSHPEAFALEGEQPVFEKDPVGKGTFYQSNLTNGSGFYVPRSSVAKMGPGEWLFATNSAVLNPLYQQVVTNPVVAAYINVDEPADMNRLYPYIAEVWNQYPDQLDMKNYNFFYLADDEHNKERDVCWTDLYVDPAGQDWMFSCIAPVYVGDSLKAVVGLDVKFSAIAERIERLKLPWKASVVLVTGNSRDPRSSKEAANRIEGGTIIDATQGAWGLLRLEPPSAKYDYTQEGPITKDTRLGRNIFEIKDTSLSESLKMKFAKPDGDLTKVSTNGEELLVANASIPSTGWQLFVLVEESAIFEPIRKLRELTHLIGWAAVGLMGLFYAFFFVWLWNRSNKMATSISGPLNQLSRATSNLGEVSEEVFDIPSTGIDEIDRLSASFAKMSTSLKEQTKKLVDARVNSEMKEKEAELAFTRGLYQSASANLHDAGNAVTVLESSLLDLNKVVKSTEKYPEVFRRLKHDGAASRAILERFEYVLVGETVPRLRVLASSILRLKDAIKRSIHEQQAAFRAVKRQGEFKKEFAQASQAVDLTALLHEICEIFRRDYPALETAIAPGLTVRSHRTQLWAGLDNLIRNAVHASPERGPIHVAAVAVANGVMVKVTDQGEGISGESLGKVGERGYTTKPGGHGLGLNGFREFLELFGGSLRVHSPGLRQGTTVTVEIRNA